MEEDQERSQTRAPEQTPGKHEGTMVIRIPKLNMHVALLGLVAFITLFQTFQLVRINSASASALRSEPSTVINTGTPGTGSDASVPQSMVGGC